MQKIEKEQISKLSERTYIAHELHDSLAQTLASLRYHVRNLDHAIQGGSECEMYEILEVLENNVETANTELRELIHKFRAPMDEASLIPGIESLLRKFKEETGVKTVFHNSLAGGDFEPNYIPQILRIVQEALTNIRKHANAKDVRVAIRQESGKFHVIVEDSGQGFDFEKHNNDSEGHFGLRTMVERAARINGELIIESEPEDGARVHLIFPELANKS